MPIYEYVCNQCEHEFEEFVPTMADPRGLHCPSCRGKTVKRKLSLFAARQGRGDAVSASPAGGCGRCGDPAGPCTM